jgi:hypothetical protein
MNDPVLKDYHRRRVNPKAQTNMTKAEKRAGIYDSILDIARRRQEYFAAKAANDNSDAKG